MKPLKQPHVPALIASDPRFRAVVRAVGFGKPSNNAVVEKLKEAIAEFGEKNLADVSRVLLDFETHGSLVYCRIKLEFVVYCRQFLGPMPSEMDDWYKNADGTDHPGKPDPWPPLLPGPPGDLSVLTNGQLANRLRGAQVCRSLVKRTKRRAKADGEEVAAMEAECRRRNLDVLHLPGPTKEQVELQGLSFPELAGRLHDARLRFIRNRSPRTARKAHQEVQPLLAEFARRETVPPPEATPDGGLTAKTEKQLNAALQKARERYNRYAPGSSKAEAASHVIDRLYEEYRRRGLTIPAFKSAESEKHTKERNRFRRLTTQQLKDLLDRSRYESEKYKPSSARHQEAKRDIGLIEAELRARSVAIPEPPAKEVA